MTLKQHLTITGVAAAALLPFREPAEVLLFSAGSVLIDVDHYLLYVQRTRSFDIPGMFRYFDALQPVQKTIPYVGLCLFHTVDFFLLVGVLTFFHPILLPLLAGFLFHFAADLIDLHRKGVPFIRAYFLLEHAIRRRSEGYPWY
ncbi:MAG TPA: hypothetical protein VL949_05275 [Geobacteraceae bacterium]|jgi:hypothetical protein|nr:hypothetical protein [Geobacteraceae bacterium]